MSRMTRCFWNEYQRTGKTEDLTRWLKHRAYMHMTGSDGKEVSCRSEVQP